MMCAEEMRYLCAVPNCKKTLQSGVLFYPFPTTEPLRSIWLDKLKLRQISPTHPLKICNTHFEPSDFHSDNQTLKAIAVPSLNLNVQARFAFNGDSKFSRPSLPKKPIVTRIPKPPVKQDPSPPPTPPSPLPPPPPTRQKPCRKAAMIAAERITNVPQLEEEEEEDYRPKRETSRKRAKSHEDKDLDFIAESSKSHKKRKSSAYGVAERLVSPKLEQDVKMTILSNAPDDHSHLQPQMKPHIVNKPSKLIKDLIMECSDDALSTTQALHFNNLRHMFTSHREKVARLQIHQANFLEIFPNPKVKQLHSPPPSPPPTPPLPEVHFHTPEPESTYTLPPPRQPPPPTPPPPATDLSLPYQVVVDEAGAVLGVLAVNKSANEDLVNLIDLLNKERQQRKEQRSPVYPCLVTINGGTQHASARTMLSLSVKPSSLETDPNPTIRAFHQWLTEENLFQKPLQWMQRQGMLELEYHKCSICNSHMSFEPDPGALDGYSWRCLFPKCGVAFPVTRPKFFVRFGLPMERLVRVCCQWALQLGPREGDEVHQVRAVFRGLQELCGWALDHNQLEPLIGPVEVGLAWLVGCGCWVVGAYCRTRHNVRLQAVPSPDMAASLVSSWLAPSATLLSDPAQTGLLSGYLSHHLNSIFGNLVLSQLSLRDVRGFLYELQWRELFGSSGLTAFWNIFNHIAQFSNCQAVLGPHLLQLEEEESSGSSSEPEMAELEEEDSRRKGRRRCSDCKYPVVPTVLEEFYYAKMNPLKPPPPLKTKFKSTFQCHECKATITSNFQMMSHLRQHMDHQLNSHLAELTRCMWCYKSFPSPYTQQCHLERHHLREEGRFHCRICLVAFSSPRELLQHMTSLHHRHDMPYSCKVCGFRSSFHKDIVEHFAEAHGESHHLLCQFCLRVYAPKTSVAGLGMTRSYLQHMRSHCDSPDSRRCSRCALVFSSDQGLRLHRRTDHYYHPPPSAEVTPYSSPLPPDRAIIVEPKTEEEEEEEQSLKLELNWNTILCLECHDQVDQEHFRNRVHCDRCSYTSHCLKAFVDHMVSLHGGRKPRQFLQLMKLPSPGTCPCGFQSYLGNSLAEHLITCKKAFALLEKPERDKSVKATEAFLESLMDDTLDADLLS